MCSQWPASTSCTWTCGGAAASRARSRGDHRRASARRSRPRRRRGAPEPRARPTDRCARSRRASRASRRDRGAARSPPLASGTRFIASHCASAVVVAVARPPRRRSRRGAPTPRGSRSMQREHARTDVAGSDVGAGRALGLASRIQVCAQVATGAGAREHDLAAEAVAGDRVDVAELGEQRAQIVGARRDRVRRLAGLRAAVLAQIDEHDAPVRAAARRACARCCASCCPRRRCRASARASAPARVAARDPLVMQARRHARDCAMVAAWTRAAPIARGAPASTSRTRSTPAPPRALPASPCSAVPQRLGLLVGNTRALWPLFIAALRRSRARRRARSARSLHRAHDRARVPRRADLLRPPPLRRRVRAVPAPRRRHRARRAGAEPPRDPSDLRTVVRAARRGRARRRAAARARRSPQPCRCDRRRAPPRSPARSRDRPTGAPGSPSATPARCAPSATATIRSPTTTRPPGRHRAAALVTADSHGRSPGLSSAQPVRYVCTAVVDVLDAFHPLVAGWFRERFGAPDRAAARGLAADRRGRGRADRRADRLRQDARRVPRLPRRAGPPRARRAARRSHGDPLRLAAQGAVQRRPAQPRGAARRARRVRRGARASGCPEIRVAVRTGDTPVGERAKMAKRPPHILVTTPESLYILLTTRARPRRRCPSVRTVIVDEIHAIAGDKRGAHLALVARAARSAGHARPPGARRSASGCRRPRGRSRRSPGCSSAPGGRCRTSSTPATAASIDLAIEITDDELGAVASQRAVRPGLRSDRRAGHRSTARRSCSSTRGGSSSAPPRRSSSGSARSTSSPTTARCRARCGSPPSSKLKHGQVKCAVATASLELGIDVGTVDLVVQLGSPRSIATLLQRVGRSGHHLGGTPKGRLFALTRDQLVECAALVRGVRRGNLDAIALRDAPLDILAQQIVATLRRRGDPPRPSSPRLVRGAAPYAELADDKLEQILVMLSEGVSDRRGRVGAHLHRDRVAGVLRGRRGARLAAITSGGAIPDNNNYAVVQWPEETQVGEVDEDFAIESSAGDIFQLGNTAWRIRRIEAGRVLVEDAERPAADDPVLVRRGAGAHPRAVRRGQRAARRRSTPGSRAGEDADAIAAWLAAETSMALGARAADRRVPRRRPRRARRPAAQAICSIAERFFDEGGGMQLVHPRAARRPDQPRVGPRAAQEVLPHVRLRAPGGGHRRRHRDLARPAPQLPARYRVRLRAVAPGARPRWSRRCSIGRCSRSGGGGTSPARSPCCAGAAASGCRRT